MNERLRIKNTFVFSKEDDVLEFEHQYSKEKLGGVTAYINDYTNNISPLPNLKKNKFKEHVVFIYKIPKGKLDKWDSSESFYNVYVSKEFLKEEIAKLSPNDSYLQEESFLNVNCYDVDYIGIKIFVKEYTLITMKQLYDYCVKRYLKTIPTISEIEDLESLAKIYLEIYDEYKHSKGTIFIEKKSTAFKGDYRNYLYFDFFNTNTYITELNSAQMHNLQHLKIIHVKRNKR